MQNERMKINDLLYDAQADGIPVIFAPLPETGSLCVQLDGQCYIGIDDSVLCDSASYRVHLAHELGHCKTGAFYNRWAADDVRQKHENKADKWAIQRMIPEDELDEAVADGCTELWQLAERFDVTEDFMKKAVCWYTYGNVSDELYF